MRRKSALLTLGAVILLLGGTGTGLALLVWHEPSFYRERAMPAGLARQQQSNAFVENLGQLFSGIQGGLPTWRVSFTERQINSFLQEDFVKKGYSGKVLPSAIADPRVGMDGSGLRLAFRYGRGAWSTIISIRLRPWLVPTEVNTVAVELQGLHAGALPISAQSLLERFGDVAVRYNIGVTWYRHNGNPVALLRFHADKSRPAVQLQYLEAAQGALTLAGQSLDRTPRVIAAPSVPAAPAKER